MGSSGESLKNLSPLDASVTPDSDSIKPSKESGRSNKKQKKQKLSRPERKALERAKKARSNRKHNYSDRKNILQSDASGKNGYKLHSNAVSQLDQNSSADDVMRAIKRAQNLHDVHDVAVIENFLLNECDESFAYGYRGSLLARLAVAALHMNNQELAKKAINERKLKHKDTMLPMEGAALIRGLLRVHDVDFAIKILDDELSIPSGDTPLTDPANKECIKQRALSLASIASRHFFEGEPSMAVKACTLMTELGPIVRESGLDIEELKMPWTRIIQGAAQCESCRRDGSVKPCEGVDVELPCNLVYAVLNAMTTFPSDNDDRTYEALSNALVRRTVFVTGAVGVAGLPKADRGEAVFIGRSNVGKSSLVNMITNRKSLAYTSKRPGKTQQYNYFAVNDKPGRDKEIRYGDVLEGEKDPDSFYIVDLPGFGFAKVPQQQRQQWSDFLETYISTRKSLKVVFHLVDARHGPIDEDMRIMKQIGTSLPRGISYVVVLTKADKNVKGPNSKNSGKVSRDVMGKLRDTMRQNKVGNAPVILTSSETKLGRDDIW
eukprot:CAMPEP_0195286802 /NCGR_PEP_ID=MMETSP0707-20130614/4124_1 /TAXON_ID=33640 /ORGANISM="Asterionellopsis glacialis, Strain CCMP134" /LENGTH=548 /DNA_ID=CAMNT_0040346491 /DNA_START=130 /DNA_END=1774 /DNA_ORIENTATION=-